MEHLPPAVRTCLRAALQALAIARESIEGMQAVPHEKGRYPGPAELQGMSATITVQELALSTIGATSSGKVSPAVRKVQSYVHRFKSNLAGLERLTLALELAAGKLQEAMDAFEEDTPIICGCYWTLCIMADCCSNSCGGEIRKATWNRKHAAMDRETINTYIRNEELLTMEHV